MAATPSRDATTRKADDLPAQLRLNVYDALAKARGIQSPTQAARVHGISRAQMYRLRKGERKPSLALALRMARDLDTTVEVLFERNGAA